MAACSGAGRREQPPHIAIIAADMNKYPFRRWFQERLQTDLIEKIHLQYDVNVDNFTCLTSELRKKCEENISELKDVIKCYCEQVIEPLVGSILVSQADPTVRIYLAVNDPKLQSQRLAMEGKYSYQDFLQTFYSTARSAKVFHRDVDYGVHFRALNLWLPVTAVFGTNSLWIGSETEYGRDATPAQLEIGEALIFDGANRWHGTVWNTSGYTRASFDWRFVPENRPCAFPLRA